MSRNIVLFILICGLLVLAGCSGAEKKPNPRTVVSEELDGAPDWVLTGHDDNDKTLSAIGSVTGTNNVALARSTALGRARSELVRQLQVFVKTELRDYQNSVTGGGAFGEAADDEQFIEDTSVQTAELSISGSRQEDTWISKTGTYYVLVALDVDAFLDTVAKMDKLSEEVRKAVTARAEEAFSRLDSR